MALLLTACVTETPGGNAGLDGGGLDPARPADRQLIAYGQAHPECRMWTNWEKLCSRTVANRSVVCQTDPARPVTPSAPFCARDRSEARPSPVGPAEQASKDRFCVRYYTVASAQAIERGVPPRFCSEQDPDRPFNGRRIAALMQPGCDGLADAERAQLVCTRRRHSRPGIPDCARLARAGYEDSRLLQCSGWSGPRECRAFPIRPPGGIRIAFGAPPANDTAVHGTFCENY